jgi:hypothetical protein
MKGHFERKCKKKKPIIIIFAAKAAREVREQK